MIGMNRITITNLTPSDPLFIRLDEFNVVNRGNTNDLSWKTATEEAGDRFEIERSVDGKNFDKIGAIDAKGSAPSVYGFIDQSPLSGTNYYRLKFMNSDGSIFYSNIASANLSENKESAISVYPNPMTDKLNIIAGWLRQNMLQTRCYKIRNYYYKYFATCFRYLFHQILQCKRAEDN